MRLRRRESIWVCIWRYQRMVLTVRFWPTVASRVVVATWLAADSRRDQFHCRS